MKEFREKYIEDVTDSLSDLEKDLLKLEENPKDKELINSIFRVMHSLKGVSSMYGYDKIGDLTHHLETVYDCIRHDELHITKKILNITFSSVDFIKSLLHDPEFEKKENQEFYDGLIHEITKAYETIPSDALNDRIKKYHEEIQHTGVKQTEENAYRTFYIEFTPDYNIFDRGINALTIIEELNENGQARVFMKTNKIPEFKDVNPIGCYVSWHIFFVTKKDINAIQDIFIFVDDETEIHLVANENLFQHESFIEKIMEIEMLGKAFESDDFEEFLKDAEDVNEINGAETSDFNNTIVESKAQEISPSDINMNSVRVASDKLDDLINLVSELVTTKAELSMIATDLKYPRLDSVSERIDKIARQLRDNALDIRLVPIQSMILYLKRMVRDLSSELKKTVDFMVEGTETELDKTIIDNLKEPIMHIIRNALDHGIEPIDQRKKQNKPEKGVIRFVAFYSGINVFIQIQDDGQGINPQKIRAKAIEKKLINPEQNLSDKELFSLLFLPGFSTAQQITEVSGRGVGLDVVKKRIADIRGEVEIDSELNLGTTFTIKLPLSLSIIDTLLVKVANSHFLIPLGVVNNCDEQEQETIQKTSAKRLLIDEEIIPYIYLRDEFEIYGERAEGTEKEKIVIVQHENKKVAIIVDIVVGEYQAVLKPLGEMFKNLDMISGASILGDGSVALVLDTNKLIDHYATTKTKQSEEH